MMHDRSVNIYTYISKRLLLWIVQNSTVIKANKLIMSDHVVLPPCYDAVFVSVKLREALLCIFQSVLSVDVLDP